MQMEPMWAYIVHGEPMAAYRGLQFLLGLQPPTACAQLPTGDLHFPDDDMFVKSPMNKLPITLQRVYNIGTWQDVRNIAYLL
jgi:hypothetical protein